MGDDFKIKKGHVFINKVEIPNVKEVQIRFMPSAQSEINIKFLSDNVTIDQVLY